MRRPAAGEGGGGQPHQGEGHHQAEGDVQGGSQGSHVTADAVVCLCLKINDPKLITNKIRNTSAVMCQRFRHTIMKIAVKGSHKANG